MAITVAFVLIDSFYMDFEAARELLLSITGDEFQSIMHSYLMLGFYAGLILFAGNFVFSRKALLSLLN